MRILALALVAIVAAPLLPAAALDATFLTGDASQVGEWGEPFEWPVEAVHAALLPTGEVLIFANGPDAHLFNPTTGAFTAVPAPEVIVCSGMAMLPDGRLLVNGGDNASIWMGSAQVLSYDPWTRTWEKLPDMQAGRYYPGTITLANGNVLTYSGNGPDGREYPTPEIWNGQTWTLQPSATQPMEFYPRMHVIPGGEVIIVGQQAESYRYDPDTATLTPGPVSTHGLRWGGASVLMPDLKTVLLVGGGSMGFASEGWALPAMRDDAPVVAHHVASGREPASASVQSLDISDHEAEWQDAASLQIPRRDFTLVLLADGSPLAVGGGAGFEAIPGWVEHAVAPERYDAGRNAWDLMAPSTVHRGYHSTALLLPDGRVLAGGGDFELGHHGGPGITRTAEIYSPPYLSQGARPQIINAPTEVEMGGALPLRATLGVDAIHLVRVGSVTHSLNTDQRVVSLPFDALPGGNLVARMPNDSGATPPGWYMLFALREGVPSHARMIHVA